MKRSDFPPQPPALDSPVPRNRDGTSASSSSPKKMSAKKVAREMAKLDGGVWSVVEASGLSPCQRSLHTAATWNGNMYVFGGYNGTMRVNDLHCYNFAGATWSHLTIEGDGDVSNVSPPPRDRHTSCVWGNGLYVFAGFDGLTRVNDMHCLDLQTLKWSVVSSGDSAVAVPSPRHSHAAVVYGDSMFCFSGYDGSYKNDFHEFNFVTSRWSPVQSSGKVPKARYRGTCVVHGHEMILHGGHDGNKHLHDTHIFNFLTRTWTEAETTGSIPDPRDSHVSVVHGHSMYILGGSTGGAVGDFHRLDLEHLVWTDMKETSPRFCHTGVMFEDAVYCFGGYDGAERLNDFIKFSFYLESDADGPSSALISDLKRYVNNELLSDITFVVENRRIYSHKLMCLRCPYFHSMLTGEYMESRAAELVIDDVRYEIFLLFLEFVYSDSVEITLDVAMELFQSADRFGMERLKSQCEEVMNDAITVHTAAQILLAADLHGADMLRERCMCYIQTHFESVSVTTGFEDMSRASLDLNLEIIRRRFSSKAL